MSGSSNAWAALNTQRSQHQAKMFAKADADSDGQLSQTEFEAARPQPPGGGQAAEGLGGPIGPGGPGGPGGASSDTTYDALDTNQDGTLSELERMVSELREAIGDLSDSDDTNDTASNQQIAELAQKIYAQVAQSLTETSANSLSVTA